MTGLSEDQIFEIQETFSLFETRGNGKVEASKIGDILRALGLNPTEADVQKLVGEVKDGGNGMLAFQSFLPLYVAVAKRKDENTSTAEDFIEGFRVFDKDANGTISSAELRHLLTTLGEKMEEVDVENLIAPFEDQHGNINYEDFVKHILQSANQWRFYHWLLFISCDLKIANFGGLDLYVFPDYDICGLLINLR